MDVFETSPFMLINGKAVEVKLCLFHFALALVTTWLCIWLV